MSLAWILYQEKDWLVVDKPTGLSVHNEPGKDLISIFSGLLKSPVSPVYRLDQETSGVIVLSLSAKATSEWHRVLEQDSTEKDYLCVVRGEMKLSLQSDSPHALWSLPLTDKAEGRNNPQGATADRKTCETLYQVIQSNRYMSMLSCRINTGRQHQIRKHAALAKHAVVGDSRYGDPKYNAMIKGRYGSSRLYLHAQRLKCVRNGTTCEWMSPIPPEFSKMFPDSAEKSST